MKSPKSVIITLKTQHVFLAAVELNHAQISNYNMRIFKLLSIIAIILKQLIFISNAIW